MRALLTTVFLLTAVTARAEDLVFESVAGGDGLPLVVASNKRAEAPGLFFIHGFISSMEIWHRQMSSELPERFNFAAVDLRGHGGAAKPWQSEHYLGTKLWADDVHAALEHSGGRKPVVVTHSYGAYFLMDYIRHYGTSKIGGVVIVSSSAGFAPKPKPELTETRIKQIARSTSANAFTLMGWTEDYLRLVIGDEDISDAEFNRLKTASMMTPHYVRPFNREHRTDNTDLIDNLDVPIRLVSGEKDRFANHDELTEVASKLPNAQLVIMKGAGNMPFLFQSERFNQLVSEFSQSIHEAPK